MIRRSTTVIALAASFTVAWLAAPRLAHAQNSWPMFHPVLATQHPLPCGESVHDEGTHRDQTYVMTFDARGRVLTRTETVSGGSGTRVTSYRYDAQGRPAGEEFRDGDETFQVTYTLDANGRPVTRDMQSARGRIRMHLAWDAHGLLTRVDYDNDANGSVDMVESFGYEHGRLTTFEQRVGDRVQYSERYFYDARGRLARMERDLMNNGTVDLRRTYSFDARGRLAREDNDRRADGTIDDSRTYRYDCR